MRCQPGSSRRLPPQDLHAPRDQGTSLRSRRRVPRRAAGRLAVDRGSPQLVQPLELLLEPPAATAERSAERLVVVGASAQPDAQVQAPAGDAVDHGGLPGQQRLVVGGQQHRGGRQAYPLGHGGGCRQRRQRVPGVVVGTVVHGHAVEPGLVRPLAQSITVAGSTAPPKYPGSLTPSFMRCSLGRRCPRRGGHGMLSARAYLCMHQATHGGPAARCPDRMSLHSVRFTLNGEPLEVTVPAERLLIELLRDELGATGTKLGCGVGVCGACTVLVDDRPMSACLLLAVHLDGTEVRTVEGLAAEDGTPTPLQEAFARHGGFQCGICTSGQLMAATALLEERPRPTEEEVRRWLMGNLCRCTGYYQIVEAVLAAARSG